MMTVRATLAIEALRKIELGEQAEILPCDAQSLLTEIEDLKAEDVRDVRQFAKDTAFDAKRYSKEARDKTHKLVAKLKDFRTEYELWFDDFTVDDMDDLTEVSEDFNKDVEGFLSDADNLIGTIDELDLLADKLKAEAEKVEE